MISLAIVGSRDMIDDALFAKGIEAAIVQWGLPDMVVSGGARGADTLGAQWAIINHVTLRVFEPDWKRYGKAAGIIRNKDIIGSATHVLAFPSKSGKGTQNSINLAQKKKKPLLVYWID